MPSRFVVTELEGYAINPPNYVSSGNQATGLSLHVIDTHWNNHLVATYRTEDHRYGRRGVGNRGGTLSTAESRARVRALAYEHAERLNAQV